MICFCTASSDSGEQRVEVEMRPARCGEISDSESASARPESLVPCADASPTSRGRNLVLPADRLDW